MLNQFCENLHYNLNHPHWPYNAWKRLFANKPLKVDWDADAFGALAKKWCFVPAGPRAWLNTKKAYKKTPMELAKAWERSFEWYTTGPNYAQRGWYHKEYSPQLAGKKIIDIGSGLAVDTIKWARDGAQVTFLDVVETNLEVITRLSKYFGFKAEFLHLKHLEDLKHLPYDFDFAFALGSLHHAPSSVIKPEVQELIRHIKPGGRWIQLAYPKSRWMRDGQMDFGVWGIVLDGRGTPWAEWYDIEKLKTLWAPACFEVIKSFEFADNQFIWFDLKVC